MKKVLALIMTLVLCFAALPMTACGGVTGTYKFESMTIAGLTYNVGDTIAEDVFGDALKLEKDTFVLDLGGDNVAKFSMKNGDEVEEMTGTYDVKEMDYLGEKVQMLMLNISGIGGTYRIKDGKISIGMTGMGNITLKKGFLFF